MLSPGTEQTISSPMGTRLPMHQEEQSLGDSCRQKEAFASLIPSICRNGAALRTGSERQSVMPCLLLPDAC